MALGVLHGRGFVRGSFSFVLRCACTHDPTVSQHVDCTVVCAVCGCEPTEGMLLTTVNNESHQSLRSTLDVSEDIHPFTDGAFLDCTSWISWFRHRQSVLYCTQ